MTTKIKDWEIRKIEKPLGDNKSEKMFVACNEDSVADAAMALKLMINSGALGKNVRILMLADVPLARFRKAFGDEALLDSAFRIQSEYSEEKDGYVVHLNLDRKNHPDLVCGLIIH